MYIGFWQEDLRHDKGTLIYANGDKYIGEWFKDKIICEGEYIYNETGKSQ